MQENTSQVPTQLFKPVSGKEIPAYTLSYISERNRNNVHDFILGCLRESGLTQAEIARRLGKAPELINRKIGAPGNWTLDTVSELLFAINGCEPVYSKGDFLSQAPSNYCAPDWANRNVEDNFGTDLNQRIEGTSTIPNTGELVLEPA